MRERKKRGKASRKDIAQQQAAAAAAAAHANGTAPPSGDSTTGSPQSRSNEEKGSEPQSAVEQPLEGQRPLPELPPPSLPQARSASMATTRDMDGAPIYQNVPISRTMSMSAIDAIPENQMPSDGMHHPMQPPRIQTQGLHTMHNPIPEYASMEDFNRNMMHQSPHHPMMQSGMHPIVPSNMEYTNSPYDMMSPQSAQAPPNTFRMPQAESPMPGYIGTSPVSGSPGWLSLPSPSTTMYHGAPHANSQQLRYPVLQPLVPHLTNIMPLSLACDLLELYFQSSSSAFMQPVSPYILGYVFRKESFLRQNNPRVCSPALLASMLWIGCLTSESPYLASSPSARSQLSEKLINLTISLLKPLVHQSPSEDASPTFNGQGATMNQFGIPMAPEPELAGLQEHQFDHAQPRGVLRSGQYAVTSAGAPGGIDDIVSQTLGTNAEHLLIV